MPAPDPTPIALRLIVAGDGGEPGPVHAAAFGSARVLAHEGQAPAMLLMPGDLTYPSGLPQSCAAARERLRKDYLDPVPVIPIVVVPGNHDHGDLEKGTNRAIAARDSWFDCQEQPSVVDLTGWDAQACPCDSRWRAPLGRSDVATMAVLEPMAGRPRFSILAYDSQKALSVPDQVAGELSQALDEVPTGQQVLVLAHHPLVSSGPHAHGDNPQDASSPTYQAYVKAVSEVFHRHADKILLLAFGHDHNLQYRPGSPPQLVSGAASKISPVTGEAPAGGFQVGDTAGLALVDLLQNGDTRITLVWSGAPWVTTLPARSLSVR